MTKLNYTPADSSDIRQILSGPAAEFLKLAVGTAVAMHPKDEGRADAIGRILNRLISRALDPSDPSS